ncbi:conserved hypothetical protein [Leishmania mexicana MHOM/GT/2001/U1103]|uniref:Uncharacterized protein n=1 Tax=Leishmania mexicana (strain MHOM/GT/2001/U1103) TaxID=929439 RepID=E9AWH6_LEIMU|nr:conserved hypothetical protein [Leishmania mexicana MHOM/GT/2001/U1103]CBZ27312.1 conserved hypothetical protein [Leishmania mexicana MHOM/GT/2001/U1103]
MLSVSWGSFMADAMRNAGKEGRVGAHLSTSSPSFSSPLHLTQWCRARRNAAQAAGVNVVVSSLFPPTGGRRRSHRVLPCLHLSPVLERTVRTVLPFIAPTVERRARIRFRTTTAPTRKDGKGRCALVPAHTRTCGVVQSPACRYVSARALLRISVHLTLPPTLPHFTSRRTLGHSPISGDVAFMVHGSPSPSPSPSPRVCVCLYLLHRQPLVHDIAQQLSSVRTPSVLTGHLLRSCRPRISTTASHVACVCVSVSSFALRRLSPHGCTAHAPSSVVTPALPSPFLWPSSLLHLFASLHTSRSLLASSVVPQISLHTARVLA